MEIVLIDLFIVPEEAKTEFVAGANNIQEFIRTLPGFVEGYVYDKADGESRYNFLTTAVWESDEAFENAKMSVKAEYERRGYNPVATAQRLGVEPLRSVYRRTPY